MKNFKKFFKKKGSDRKKQVAGRGPIIKFWLDATNVKKLII